MELNLVLIAFTLGIILVMLAIPPIIRVGNAKKLFDYMNERKIHNRVVPPLGGVAIFIGFCITSIIVTDEIRFDELKYFLASVIILFFIGLKDDLMDISAWKKLGVQIFAAFILVSMGDVRFTSLYGVLGIYEIGLIPSVLISIFTVVVIINAFNLIDGIDGLASGLAIMASGILGFWFFAAGFTAYAIMSFALAGSLTGFFVFNVFGDKNKLFMGDTGSLIIGLLVAGLIIKFNEFNSTLTEFPAVNATPVVSFALIIVPLIDTLRVMTIRIRQKRSPFSADTNHIHHLIFYFQKRHIIVTMILVAANLAFFLLAVLLNRTALSVNYQLLIIVLSGILVSFIPSALIRIDKLKQKELGKKSFKWMVTRLFF